MTQTGVMINARKNYLVVLGESSIPPRGIKTQSCCADRVQVLLVLVLADTSLFKCQCDMCDSHLLQLPASKAIVTQVRQEQSAVDLVHCCPHQVL